MKTRGIHVAFLLWLLIIKRAKTDGKLDIRFIIYWSDGKKNSGMCCDGRPLDRCHDNCDPKFTLCIDRYFISDGRHLCSLYKSTTNYTENKNMINFGSSIQGTANHFIIHVPKAVPSSIHIQVEVYDCHDISSDDHMDTLSKLINIRAAVTQQEAEYTQYTLLGRTKLYFKVRAYCDPDWYGSACERYCKATTDHSHCTCHPHTGVKMCFEGWKGDNCNQDIDESTEIDNTCQNWGSCTNTLGSFGCICMEGIKDIINITLLGEIDHRNKGDLTDGLNRLITELGGIPGKADVRFMTNTHRENNFTTTYVQFYSDVENGSFIESPLLDEIFESNPDEVINEYLPLPLYPPREEANANTKSPHDSWDTNQSVSTILPPVGLVLMSVLLMVAFCIWRRRSSKTQQCRDDNQLSSFVMDVACNPQPPRAMTGNLHEASVSPDGYTSLRFLEVEEGSHDTSCDDTSNINLEAEDMTLYPDSQHGFGVYPYDNARVGKAATRDTHCDDTSNMFLATEDMTLDDLIVHCFRFSPDDNARLGDAATFDTNRDDTTKLHLPTEDMTNDQVILHGVGVCPDDKASLGDVATLRH